MYAADGVDGILQEYPPHETYTYAVQHVIPTKHFTCCTLVLRICLDALTASI